MVIMFQTSIYVTWIPGHDPWRRIKTSGCHLSCLQETPEASVAFQLVLLISLSRKYLYVTCVFSSKMSTLLLLLVLTIQWMTGLLFLNEPRWAISVLINSKSIFPAHSLAILAGIGTWETQEPALEILVLKHVLILVPIHDLVSTSLNACMILHGLKRSRYSFTDCIQFIENHHR